MSEFKRIKAALIGCGTISDIYLKNLTERFYIVEMVGCADLDRNKACEKAKKYGLSAMTVEEILEDEEIRIVINTTWPLSHYEITKSALQAGKCVYTEKMLAPEFEKGKELVDLAREKGLLFAAAPDTFLGGGWQSARNMLDNGWIGKPVVLNAACIRSYQDYGSVCCEPKSFVYGYGSGIPFDMGGYYLHAMINLLGPVRRVSGFAQTRESSRPYLNPRHPKFGQTFTVDSPNSMCASLEFENGTLANLLITSEAFSFEKPLFELYGEEGGMLLFDPNDFSGEIRIKRNTMTEYAMLSSLFPYNDDSRGLGVADMAYALAQNRKPRTDAEIGLHALEAMHGVCQSAQTGQVYRMTTRPERPLALPMMHADGDAYENCLRERS